VWVLVRTSRQSDDPCPGSPAHRSSSRGHPNLACVRWSTQSEAKIAGQVNPKNRRKSRPLSLSSFTIMLSLYIHTYMHTYIYICMYVCVCMSYVYFAQLIGLYLTLLHAPVIERTSSEKRHICVSSGIPVLSKVGFVNLPSDGHV
jgi:hypothetical protein